MKVGKKLKRIAAAGLAGILVLGSINLSGLSVSADNSGRRMPYYDDGQRKYVYDTNDILGAATHVHLFGRTVISNAHTHGNIFCQTGRLGENGTRQENNDTTDGIGSKDEFNPISWYHEVNYIQQELECINAASSLDVLVVGNGISYNGVGTQKWVQTTEGRAALDKTNGIYQDTLTQTAINFDQEFALLENRSREWAAMPTSPNISYDITSDQNMNNRYIDVNGRNAGDNHVYLNVTYNEWRFGGNGNHITIKGLDGTTTNKGVLIINIDMKGIENPDFSLNGGGLRVETNNGTFNNREFKTSEYGSYRILFNLYDSSASDKMYHGNATFSNVVCGSILAPRATVTVGAVNGTVAAETIIHNGQESHRMDLWALGTEGDSDYENPYVDLTLYKGYEGIVGSVDESILAATTFGLYSDASCTAANRLATAYPYNNAEGKAEITFTRAISSLSVGDNIFYIKEISAPYGYTASDTVYQCKITVNGEGKVESVQYSDGGSFSTESPICVNERTTTTTENGTVTLSLIKIYQPLPASEIDRQTLLSNTTFELYQDASCNNFVEAKHPEYVNGNQAVVSFGVNMSGLSGTNQVTYYLKETAAPSGYTQDSTVYACRITRNGGGGYSVTYAALENGVAPADNAFTSDFPQCVNVKEGTQTPEQPKTVDVTFEIEKIFEGFADLSSEEKEAIIKNTSFALYSNAGCTIKVGDFGSGSLADGKITYQFTRKFTGLNENIQYFYIKEAGTDENAYQLSQQVYQVLVSVNKDTHALMVQYALYRDADGKIVGSLTNTSGTAETPKFTNQAVTTGTPEEPKPEEPTPPVNVDREVSISLIKTFSDNFDGLSETERSSVIGKTTFGLYADSACSSPVAGFAADGSGNWDETAKQVTYQFKMTVTNLSEDPVYYYLKETGTDTNRYTLSSVIWAVKVWLPEGADKASVEYSVYSDESGQKGTADSLTYGPTFPQYNNVAKVTNPDENKPEGGDPTVSENDTSETPNVDGNTPGGNTPDTPTTPSDDSNTTGGNDTPETPNVGGDTPDGNTPDTPTTPPDNSNTTGGDDTPETPNVGGDTPDGNTPDTPTTPPDNSNTPDGNTPDTPTTPPDNSGTTDGNTPETPNVGGNTPDGNTPDTPTTPPDNSGTTDGNTPETPNVGGNTPDGNTPDTPTTPPDNSNTTGGNDMPDTPSVSGNTLSENKTDTPDTPTTPDTPATSNGGGDSTPSTESGSAEQTTSEAANVTETSVMVSSSGAGNGRETSTLSSMTSAQTGESSAPFMALAASLSAILAAGMAYVMGKKNKIKR